jgi:RimJ/RimL family protein N-acetyltransferase
MELADDEAEFAYWVRRDARGRGVATAALKLLTEWALRGDADSRRPAAAVPVAGAGARLHRVWLEIDSGHPASIRVAEKAGFRFAGTVPRAVGGAAATADHCLIFERPGSPD